MDMVEWELCEISRVGHYAKLWFTAFMNKTHFRTVRIIAPGLTLTTRHNATRSDVSTVSVASEERIGGARRKKYCECSPNSSLVFSAHSRAGF